MKPRVDVCVCTYKRPQSLRRLLEALTGQETGGAFDFVIHVVDNDAAGSGEPIVREFAETFPVSYAIEPEQNISLARNRSVSAAAGDYIATTDDDLEPDPRWLFHLVETATRFGADVVHGASIQRFLPGTSQSVQDFHRRPDPATGATSGYVYATGNALFRRSLIEGRPAPFEPALGRIGGEDAMFFNGLRADGATMVWCSEARVYADVPAERSTIRWILKRRFRHGITAARVQKRPLTAHSLLRGAQNVMMLAAIGTIYCTVGAFYGPWRRKGISRLVSSMVSASYHLGRIAAGMNYRFEEYKPK